MNNPPRKQITPYIQKVPLAPDKTSDYFNLIPRIWTTDGLYEVHEGLTGDEAENEAETDVEGVADGPDLGGEELGHHHPDESPVTSIAEEEE